MWQHWAGDTRLKMEPGLLEPMLSAHQGGSRDTSFNLSCDLKGINPSKIDPRPYLNNQCWLIKNIERHTAHTIVSWTDPKQWQMGHTSDLMMIIRSNTGILTIVIREMGKLNTHSMKIIERIDLISDTHSRQKISDEHFSSSIPSGRSA